MRLRRCAAAAWLLTVTVLYLFENNTGTRVVLIASWLIPLISCMMAWLSGRSAAWTMQAPGDCVQGSSGELLLRMRGCWPLTVAQVRLQCKNLFTGEEAALEMVLRRGETRLVVEPTHAGLMALHAECSVTDWLGIVRCGPIELNDAFVVRPVLLTMDVEDVRHADPGDAAGWRQGYSPENSAEVREYQPGDLVRSIHWKLSQKTGKLLVRVPERQASGEALLVLDASVTVGDASALDELGARFLSMSRYLLRHGIVHRAMWLDRQGQPQTICLAGDDDEERLMLTLYQTGVHREQALPQMENAIVCGIKQ